MRIRRGTNVVEELADLRSQKVSPYEMVVAASAEPQTALEQSLMP